MTLLNNSDNIRHDLDHMMYHMVSEFYKNIFPSTKIFFLLQNIIYSTEIFFLLKNIFQGNLITLKQSVIDSVSAYIEQNRNFIQNLIGREFQFDSFFR